MKKLLFTLGLAGLSLVAVAQVRLPKIFGSGMVLQRNAPVPVWGWAAPGEKITLTCSNQTKVGKADKTGKWLLRLDPMPAGGPHALRVAGKASQVALADVWVGEVWVCSGQSNMEWAVAQSANAKEEAAQAQYPQIRHFKVPHDVAASPLSDVKGGSWEVCSPQTVPNFTAVGYFFARELVKELNVPIGLINTSWGGTHSETWTSAAALAQDPDLKQALARVPADLATAQQQKEAEFNAMVARLQGESKNLDDSQWHQAEFDDRGWKTMPVPQLWEGADLPGFDGVVWFRREFTLTEAQAKAPAELYLGPIDDADQTYVNGTKVGGLNQYNELRHYQVPAAALRPGRNVIAIRVDDTGGGGGIYGTPDQLRLVTSVGVLPLAGPWRWRIGKVGDFRLSLSPNEYPTLLFNAMLHPLLPFGIKGAIWYQGESNAGRAHQYRTAFPLMIKDWRQHWQQGDFPFLFVQLASFRANNGTSATGSTWAELREAQTQTLALPNTGMAVTVDIGETNDIHPRNKQDVGKRLAASALHSVYGLSRPHGSPLYAGMKVEGRQVVVQFGQVFGGLVARNRYGYLNGFELAGADQKYYPAQAFVVKDAAGDKVVVSCAEVPAPVAVRYAWADDPNDANLFNQAGFPASPFRSDTWKGLTEGVKFTVGQ
jgi:sialate O-acetylesterase